MRLWRRKKVELTLADHARLHREATPREAEDILLDWLFDLGPSERQAIRRDAGWTQAEVAEHCGVKTAGMVGRWERAGSGWSRRTGLRYAHLLQELAVMRDDALVAESEVAHGHS